MKTSTNLTAIISLLGSAHHFLVLIDTLYDSHKARPIKKLNYRVGLNNVTHGSSAFDSRSETFCTYLQ